jgi:hypothetical protein
MQVPNAKKWKTEKLKWNLIAFPKTVTKYNPIFVTCKKRLVTIDSIKAFQQATEEND